MSTDDSPVHESHMAIQIEQVDLNIGISAPVGNGGSFLIVCGAGSRAFSVAGYRVTGRRLRVIIPSKVWVRVGLPYLKMSGRGVY